MGVPKVFILDNVDSFTFNLAQAFQKGGAEVLVRRADEALAAIADWSPTHLVLSPGPQRPADHPMNNTLLDRFAGRLPILGVCLGMQAINTWCEGTLRRTTPPLHGKTSAVRYAPGTPLFDRFSNPFVAARYHSLAVDRVGTGLRATAWVEPAGHRPPATGAPSIMALAHERLPLFGVQFHPESYLTEEGELLLANFLRTTSS